MRSIHGKVGYSWFGSAVEINSYFISSLELPYARNSCSVAPTGLGY